MSVVVDTTSVPSQDGFDYWREASRELFLPMRLERRQPGSFQARARLHELGGIRVARIVSDGTAICRTRSGIAQLDPEWFSLVVMNRGTSTLAQGGRTCVYGPGDITLCDSSKPFTAEAAEATDSLWFGLPKWLLGRKVARLEGQTALLIPSHSGGARLVSPFLHCLARGLDEGDVTAGEVELANSVTSLVLSLFAPTDRTRADEGLTPRIKAFIEENLSDPELCAESLARAHYLSRRRLYRLFEAEGTGVSEWIRARRLERSRSDLADPAHLHEGVFTIAQRWGFTNPAHFSRSFRDVYGLTPREYRHRALDGRRGAGPDEHRPDGFRAGDDPSA